jgi:hypothetical protein
MKLRDILAAGGIPALRKWVSENGVAGLPVAVLSLIGLQAAASSGAGAGGEI